MGVKFLLDALFKYLGVTINPAEVDAAWEQAKVILPNLDQKFTELVATQQTLISMHAESLKAQADLQARVDALVALQVKDKLLGE